MKFVRALANSSTGAVAVGAAGEAVLVAVEVLVGVAVSVQATPNKVIAAHVNTSEISFIYKSFSVLISNDRLARIIDVSAIEFLPRLQSETRLGRITSHRRTFPGSVFYLR